MRIRHTSASFSCFLNLAISLSSVCIPAPLSLFVSYTCTQRRRCAALWQQLVSSVNDLWRVSRCVSLGSFRFVSTELYLRAPFMCPQVWLPSPLRSGGGVLPNSPTPPVEDRDGKPMSVMGHCLTVELRVLRESSAARKTVSSCRHIVCTIFFCSCCFYLKPFHCYWLFTGYCFFLLSRICEEIHRQKGELLDCTTWKLDRHLDESLIFSC